MNPSAEEPTEIDPRVATIAQLMDACELAFAILPPTGTPGSDTPNRDWTADELDQLNFHISVALLHLKKCAGGDESWERTIAKLQEARARKRRGLEIVP